MEEKKPRILLAEDDISFGKILKDYLTLNGFDVIHTKDGVDGWNTFRNHHFDICVLDIMMPKRDGIELVNQIRKENKSIPIFFLTSKARKDDMLNGYQTGADDYIVKPVDADILLHKIKAILKRTEKVDSKPVQDSYDIGKYKFSFSARSLSLNGSKEVLSPKEAELLKEFCDHKNQLVKREDILRKIWKEVTYFTGRSMDVYVVKLRKHLQHDTNVSIINLPKSGYILEVKNQEII
ncbi:MAG TPA: response regulator transcription factor [Chitinophagales bacterium]|nr:response regulator transcription factor [Chitinophagales bacterium]